MLGVERFVQEITNRANPQHPHILPLFGSGEVDGTAFYVVHESGWFQDNPPITREGTTMDENETQAAAGYEFTVPQNVVIRKTATYAKVWGIFSIVLGAMQILVGLSGGDLLLAGIVSIVIGTVFIGVAGSLKAVVVTEGNDIDHMMAALQKLGNAFLIQVVATVTAVVVGIFAASAAG